MTQKQWELVMGENPSGSLFEAETRPVENVTYGDIRGSGANAGAGSFMGRVRAKTGLDGFDLPTEAQWEYACRAGTATALNTGKDLTDATQCPEMDEAGRYDRNRDDGHGGYAEHTAAGSYLPNAWGLYDMHGNVWEFCLDWYGDYPAAAVTDPAGPASGPDRVVRGGGWSSSQARECRSACRCIMGLSARDFESGFRTAFACAAATLGGRPQERTISVNFTGGDGGDFPVSTGGFAGDLIGYGEYAVEGGRWVDCTEAGGDGGVPETRIDLALQDDTGAAAPYAGVGVYLCSRPGIWKDSSGAAQSGNAQMLRCFLDDDVDGAPANPSHDHAGFKLENLPFSRYTVVVYFNRDVEGPIPAYSVNGRWYKGAAGGAAPAGASETWGNCRPGAGALSEEENTLIVRGLTSSTLVVQSPGASATARGCIAGFQVRGELESGPRAAE